MPSAKIMAWIMVIRTSAIDRLILKAIEEDGVDTIINLGAGLDTRPYRMKLPRGLNWVEVDFPHMIDLKNKKLKEDLPVCNLKRIPLDLTNRDSRKKVFEELGANSKVALVITEGVIPYLTNEDAGSLADDLASVKNFKFWIQDYNEGNMRRRVPRSWKRKLKSAPFKFKAKSWFEFFGNHGWVIHNRITVTDEAKRLKRPFPFIFPMGLILPVLWIFMGKKLRTMNGYVTMKKTP
jgi:methyltransferase (TIGR00027 family)